MSMIKAIMGKVIKACVEGKFLKTLIDNVDEYLFGRAGRFFLRLSVKVDPKKVFFHTQENRYCCNPKYICEEFLKRENTGLRFVWRAETASEGFPEGVRVVQNGTYEYFKEIMSAKYVISNSVLYVKQGFRLKKEQVCFQTWHGSLGIKRFGKKDYKGGVKWVRAAIQTGKMTDYCITNSSFVSDSLRNTYWPKTTMLEYGHPRNDIFFDSYAEKRAQIKKNFCAENGLSEDTRFVLYGPTFRDSKNFDCYNIDVDAVINAVTERFGGDWVFLLRYHSALRAVYNNQNSNRCASKVIDLTDYDDMQELMAISDIAITDYSSWIYDFVLQRKPGFIFATDIELYNNERGFCYPLETTPFPIARNNDNLVAAIKAFDEEAYATDVERFLDDKGCVEDGHASERTVNKILGLMGE